MYPTGFTNELNRLVELQAQQARFKQEEQNSRISRFKELSELAENLGLLEGLSDDQKIDKILELEKKILEKQDGGQKGKGEKEGAGQ